MSGYYISVDEIPEEYLEYMKQWDMTDTQKVEFVNSLRLVMENISDMAFGTGLYAGADWDAAKWREEQDRQWNRTPEQVYQDAYDYWMKEYGKYKIKKVGQEAFEIECREHAKRAVERDALTKRRWREFQEKWKLKEEAKKSKN